MIKTLLKFYGLLAATVLASQLLLYIVASIRVGRPLDEREFKCAGRSAIESVTGPRQWKEDLGCK